MFLQRGVLEFAGAAAQMPQAVLCNPYSAEDVADAIDKALRMSREERIARWKPMFDNVRNEDVLWWRRRFLDTLTNAPLCERNTI